MPYFERRLPHWNPEDAAILLTWRLYGSLPAQNVKWKDLPAGKRFAEEDRALIDAPGPHHLKHPEVAEAVVNTLIYAADQLHLYDLHAWVIMSNHVHILIDPHVELARITKTIKGYSAPQANIILGRTGEPFWAIEYYDHWVRTLKEFENIIRYIEFNPVKAGLVANPEDYAWSSAGLEACATEQR